MELRTIWGDVIIAVESAKTVLELVKAALAANKSLRGAVLRDAVLRDAKIETLRAYTSSLYPYDVWAILYADGRRVVRMGCLWKTLDEWEAMGIRQSNLSEFPDDGSEMCEERVALFELAKAAVLRMKTPEAVTA